MIVKNLSAVSLLVILASFSSFAESISFNMMWINNKKDLEQDFICPPKQESPVFSSIGAWLKKNEEFYGLAFNVWYDGDLISEQAVKNTEEYIKDHLYKDIDKSAPMVELKNIRELELIDKNYEVFNDNMPVYFRKDLLQVIIAYEELIGSKGRATSIFSDLNVEPIDLKKALEDKKEDLSKFGIVMARALGGFENKFQIINNGNKDLLASIKKYLIDDILTQAKECDKLHGADSISCSYDKFPCDKFNEIVYYDYSKMYYEYLKEIGSIKLNDNVSESLEENHDSPHWILIENSKEVPTIKVSFPHVSYNYNITRFYPNNLKKKFEILEKITRRKIIDRTQEISKKYNIKISSKNERYKSAVFGFAANPLYFTAMIDDISKIAEDESFRGLAQGLAWMLYDQVIRACEGANEKRIQIIEQSGEGKEYIEKMKELGVEQEVYF